jgi:putative ATP-dependent endonuclease of OLD family
VFRAFASWRHAHASKGGDKLHSILALEERESHLHPQAQRSLFSHIKAITGQRIVRTHSPYFAGQAQLEDLRLFIKKDGVTTAAPLDLSELTKVDDKRKLQDCVLESRGDILFARAAVLFEGQT